jgi:hypothetical protein
VSLAFGQAARDAGIARSMGSKGDCYDNAVAESFFATLKKELVRRRSWPSRRELTSEVFEYIEAFYNRTRRHSTLGYLSPADYENTTLINPGASLAASRLASQHQDDHRLSSASPTVSGEAGEVHVATDDRLSSAAGTTSAIGLAPARPGAAGAVSRAFGDEQVDRRSVCADAIAERAGVTVATLYRHFPTKDALIVAVVEAVLEPLATARDRALATDDPDELLPTFLREAVRLQSENRGLVDALGRSPQGAEVASSCAGPRSRSSRRSSSARSAVGGCVATSARSTCWSRCTCSSSPAKGASPTATTATST